jgi:hypothetical protein
VQEVGIAVNTVQRYMRQPIEAGIQERPAAQRLTDARRREARELHHATMRPLVPMRDREPGTVIFHPAPPRLCRDWTAAADVERRIAAGEGAAGEGQDRSCG